MNTVFLAFFTGLTTGGVSCFAVQGGLLASSIANQKEGERSKAVFLFLFSRLFAYFVLGALLGFLGSSIAISPKVQGLMQIFAGVIMLLTAFRLLDLHPVFRRFVITPPKSVFKVLRIKSREEGLFSALFLGLLTVLIPCGVTQAMILLSVASGSLIYGGLILFSFILGTTPLFLVLGSVSGKLFEIKAFKFVAASVILVLGVLSINTGQMLRGSIHTLQNYWLAATGRLEQNGRGKIAEFNKNGIQEVEVKVTTSGYYPSATSLKVGVPVRLKLNSQNAQGCIRAFTIPEYGISQVLPASGETVIEFTPTKKGKLAFTCSMGMYGGYFDVF